MDKARLAIGKRDPIAEIFLHFSVDTALVTVVRRLLDFVNMNLVEPVIQKRQKRIFGRVIVAFVCGIIFHEVIESFLLGLSCGDFILTELNHFFYSFLFSVSHLL